MAACVKFWSAILLLLVLAYGYAPNLPPDKELDRLLVRLSVRYGTDLPPQYYLQPLNYAAVNSFFARLDSSGTAGSLSGTERLLIARTERRYGAAQGLCTWSNADDDITLKANLNLLGDVRPGFDDSATMRLSGILNPSLAGNLGKLSFYSGINVWTEYRSDTLFPFCTYQPYDGVAYNLYGRDTDSSNVRSSDLPHGGVSYDAGRIRLEAAIDYLRCGPAQFFPLTLSGAAPPVTFIRAGCDLDVLYYSHCIGVLKGQKDKRKYLFMHRLEGDVWKRRVHVGINEAVVYGNSTDEPHAAVDSVLPVYRQSDRTIDGEYFIPFLPFKFIEHYSGDRDNAAVSLDVTISWPSRWRWYGEFFLDDMLSPWKLFTNDWGNKWAVTVGGNYFGTLWNRDLTVQAEISRVEPWVYTHFSGGSHRYSHFNTGLGSPLGPNSLAGVIVALLQLHPLHEVGVGINQTAYNRSVRGGKITDVFQHVDPLDPLRYHDQTTKEFLGDGTEWLLQPSLYWNFNSFGRFAFKAALMADVLDNRGAVKFVISGGLYF
jgi:hypothetical protein